jgi:hypothetical protein
VWIEARYGLILDLLTTCIHHAEVQFTDHWQTQTSILLIQSILAVSWQRLRTTGILHFPALRSSCHSHNIAKLLPSDSSTDQLTPTLTVISYSPSLFFTGWHSPELHSVESKSELLYDWRFSANQFVLASGHLRPTTRDFFNWTLAAIVHM